MYANQASTHYFENFKPPIGCMHGFNFKNIGHTKGVCFIWIVIDYVQSPSINAPC